MFKKVKSVYLFMLIGVLLFAFAIPAFPIAYEKLFRGNVIHQGQITHNHLVAQWANSNGMIDAEMQTNAGGASYLNLDFNVSGTTAMRPRYGMYLNLDDNTYANPTSLYGIYLNAETGGTGTTYGLYISSNFDYGIKCDSPFTLASLDLEPATNIDAIDITGTNMPTASALDLNLYNTGGTIMDVDWAAAKTLAAAMTGIDLNMSHNITIGGQSITGLRVKLPGTYAGGTEYGVYVEGDARTVQLCTDADSISLATTGDIDLTTASTLQVGDTIANTIKIGTTAGQRIDIGAGGALARAIDIGTGSGIDTFNIGTSGTDDINIGAGPADVDITGASSVIAGTGDALTITANAASVWSSSAGGLTITSAAASTWSTTDGALTLTGNDASTWSTQGGDLILQGGSSIIIRSTEGAVDAIVLDADADLNAGIHIDAYDGTTNGSGLINIDAGSLGIDIDIAETGAFNVNAVGAIALVGKTVGLTSQAGDITIEAESKSVVIKADEAVADAILLDADTVVDSAIWIDAHSATNVSGHVNIDAGSKGLDIDVGNTGDMNVLTNGEIILASTKNAAGAIHLDADARTDCGILLDAYDASTNVSGQITIAAGSKGLDISVYNTGDFDVSTNGRILLTATQPGADSINLDADGVLDCRISIDAYDGTTNGSGAINIDAGSKGIDIDVANSGDFDVFARGNITMRSGQASTVTVDQGDLTLTSNAGDVIIDSFTELELRPSDDNDDTLQIFTTANIVGIDALGSERLIINTNSKVYKYVYMGLGLGLTSTTILIDSPGAPMWSNTLGSVKSIGSKEGILKLTSAAHAVRFSVQLPETFIDMGGSGDLMFAFDIDEKAVKSNPTWDMLVYEYGSTAAILSSVIMPGTGGRAWATNIPGFKNGFGADADIGPDDVLFFDLSINDDADFSDIFGVRMRYRVGIEVTQ